MNCRDYRILDGHVDTLLSMQYVALMIATLEEVSAGQDRKKAIEANGIILQVKEFKFLLLLVIFDRLLSCTKSLSDQLQSKTIDMQWPEPWIW